ncbi:Inorganic triphosphatase YgiF, contains CYTH and CHAD domains [Rhodoblastus acidophilus]|uniref:Inorganic triphosphatase YgiF, contains CYTH and CHAD domains n=1 Tax=Rhodoblastus acidophilus TaxID=1074 RepID=A0A212RQ71_RHOAC|nr:CYTH and CHAD domain-containing protein [Rhodoblastus acidophilus]PPQ38515.1 hypothetical protein CKO16_09480 [Rhodoblastus acidophilus]RAI21828.1 hypothetical protein CH337_06540 [Rhodoblastus acidophilus]SNB74612.1 Inorganic triphosphatase YgiF, contains CYTH and CHAD domains [Rhodoblastus acidophilus]
MPSELEIKLRVDPAAASRMAAFAARYASGSETTRLHSTYFDDGKGSLARHGLELRVRRQEAHQEAQFVQTVKSGGGASRGEWETRLDDERPSIAAARDTPAKSALRGKAKLKPLFVVDVERAIWTLQRDGAVIELALDCGEIVAEGERAPINEAELELKSGPLAAFQAIARDALDVSGASPSFVSKGARGRRLRARRDGRVETGLDLNFESEATSAEAFAAIVAACLKQESINHELLDADPAHVEAVHEMRVAVRRLRAALSLFKPAMPSAEAGRLAAELKWMSDALGEARDRDVFIDKPMRLLQRRHPDVAGVNALREDFARRRDDAHARLIAAVRSPRFRLLLLDLAMAAAAPGALFERQAADAPFGALAAQEFARRLKKVRRRKAADVIGGSDERHRHRLRIAMKKLRYMIEFARPLARAKDFERMSQALRRAQKSLGVIHDGVAAEQALAQAVNSNPEADFIFAAGILRDELAPPPGCRRLALDAHAALRRTRPFWKDFRPSDPPGAQAA